MKSRFVRELPIYLGAVLVGLQATTAAAQAERGAVEPHQDENDAERDPKPRLGHDPADTSPAANAASAARSPGL